MFSNNFSTKKKNFAETFLWIIYHSKMKIFLFISFNNTSKLSLKCWNWSFMYLNLHFYVFFYMIFHRYPDWFLFIKIFVPWCIRHEHNKKSYHTKSNQHWCSCWQKILIEGRKSKIVDSIKLKVIAKMEDVTVKIENDIREIAALEVSWKFIFNLKIMLIIIIVWDVDRFGI